MKMTRRLGQVRKLCLPQSFRKGDRISLSLWSLDSPDYEALTYEVEVRQYRQASSILGSSPAVPVLSYDGLFCVPTVSDIDGDELTFTHQWMLNMELFSDVQRMEPFPR